jgi:hypothetical protein
MSCAVCSALPPGDAEPIHYPAPVQLDEWGTQVAADGFARYRIRSWR